MKRGIIWCLVLCLTLTGCSSAAGQATENIVLGTVFLGTLPVTIPLVLLYNVGKNIRGPECMGPCATASGQPPDQVPLPEPTPQAITTPDPQVATTNELLEKQLREQQEQTQLLQQQLWQSTFEMQKLRESIKK